MMEELVTAFILIKTGTGEQMNFLRSVKEELLKLPGVKEAYGVFGRFDVIAKVEVPTLDELARLVTDRIRDIPGVVATETMIVSV